jgi:hypothetical protein
MRAFHLLDEPIDAFGPGVRNGGVDEGFDGWPPGLDGGGEGVQLLDAGVGGLGAEREQPMADLVAVCGAGQCAQGPAVPLSRSRR